MAFIYPKSCTRIPVSTALYKAVIGIALLFLGFACSGTLQNDAYRNDITALQEELSQKTACLETVDIEQFGLLQKRYERMFDADLPSGNEAIPEVLESARLFLQHYPEDFRVLQNRHEKIIQSLRQLENMANQQQFTEAEWAIALQHQQEQLRLFYADLAYVCDNFSAWLMNAETLEKAIKIER